jgi:peptidylprolyl isomerase
MVKKILAFVLVSVIALAAVFFYAKKMDAPQALEETVEEVVTATTTNVEEIAKKAEAVITVKEKKVEPKNESKKAVKKEPKKMSTENIWNIKLKDGTVKIKLRPDLAPKHVERIKMLTKQGFYNNLKFHRVIDGFMAQTGDPQGTGVGGSSLPDLQSEFSSEPFERGVLGMARSASPHSANSQFFIMFNEGSFLNGKYTVFGEVISGMEYVDKIKKGAGQNGSVSDPDVMLEVTLGE